MAERARMRKLLECQPCHSKSTMRVTPCVLHRDQEYSLLVGIQNRNIPNRGAETESHYCWKPSVSLMHGGTRSNKEEDRVSKQLCSLETKVDLQGKAKKGKKMWIEKEAEEKNQLSGDLP